MLTKRIIPCLDIKNGRAVKGINFINLRDAGDPVELAKQYVSQGADELIFLDITASELKRKTLTDLILKVASCIDIPFTVGGGISSVKDASLVLRNGADKVSINSAAVKNPNLINLLSKKYGSQCVVVAIDAKKINNEWIVHLIGGKKSTEIRLFEWAKEVADRGAGEISIPIIASGGAGNIQHFVDTFTKGKSDAALAASIFHYGEISIFDLKKELKKKKINVRI